MHTMAFYTPPSLPRTPDAYPLHSNVSQLPIELLATIAYQPRKAQLPLTPPRSAAPPRRVPPLQVPSQMTLPPIAHLESHISRLSPVTPPQTDDASQWHTYGHAAVRLPPVQSLSCSQSPVYTNGYAREQQHYQQQQPHRPPTPQVVSPSPSPSPEERQPALDWLTTSTHRSSQFLAEKTCDMICYLWFSTLSRNASPRHDRPSSFPMPNSATATLQFAVAPEFVRFMQKVLETTQVSQSVIVLSLQYIYRLKERNRSTNGHAGSEYRVAIAALMMANKFVDDNTYTNKTWSEVSSIGLEEINRMEREFLQGIDFDLYVDKTSYESWLNLLKGLVLAKERDSRHWCRAHRPRALLHSRPHRPSARPSHPAVRSQRARSSSPNRSSLAPVAPHHHHYAQPACTPPQSGSKRSATDAFSPTDASFDPARPPKRPTGLSLDIPQRLQGPLSSHSASPSEPLQSFAKLSIQASPAVVRPTPHRASPGWQSAVHQSVGPETLASAYRVDTQRQTALPQQLYFYALACSPTEEDSRPRKARLRYHEPPAMSSEYGYAVQPTVPMVVQSACASPHEAHARLPGRAPTLPHFSEIAWDRQPRERALQAYHSPEVQMQHHAPSTAVPATCESGAQSAPFANAGPPGVHFYVNNNVQQQHTPEYNWVRSHRS